jgi:hypothetical protein
MFTARRLEHDYTHTHTLYTHKYTRSDTHTRFDMIMHTLTQYPYNIHRVNLFHTTSHHTIQARTCRFLGLPLESDDGKSTNTNIKANSNTNNTEKENKKRTRPDSPPPGARGDRKGETGRGTFNCKILQAQFSVSLFFSFFFFSTYSSLFFFFLRCGMCTR